MDAREGIARVGLGIDIRKTARGAHRHRASADHVVSVHAGAPVRVSCANDIRCVRTRGLVTVMPAGSTDEWFEDDASDHVDLRLPATLVRLAAAEMGLDPDRATVAQRCHVEDAPIEHIAWALAAELRAGEPNGLLYRQSLGMALAIHLLAPHRVLSPPSVGLSPRQLSRVKEYVEAHLDGDVSLLRLARVAGVSASHLRVLFKRSVGVSVHAYVVQRRVERARVLLSRGELPASEVALEAGFSHQSHMARCMRRVLGVTPSELRRPPAPSRDDRTHGA
ncbi:MAG: helix-turn-helix transcriptional regulator [Labilithrix sp.]|nr:helix-turn-helix transcriptional regulator [Labilithrix sp.]